MTKSRILSQRLKDLLSDRIHDLYQNQLEHELREITYQAFDNTLVILIEGTLTKPEKVLQEDDRQELTRKVRGALDRHLQPQIKALLEEITGLTVVDFLYDSTIDTERTGAIAVFELSPKLSAPLPAR
ncbi:MAG: DUF2294 domain-containing protein [Cyanobacteriota bacterium]|nr:DUF2294 domain-containing protein [Cyanobacteriota bacterium]